MDGDIDFIGYEVTVSAKNFGAWSTANTWAKSPNRVGHA